MAGLDPAIQPTVPLRIRDAILAPPARLDRRKSGLDGRVKPGHDEVEMSSIPSKRDLL